MAISLPELRGKVSIDSSELDRLPAKLGALDKSLSTSANRTASSLKSIGSSLTSAGRTLTAGITLPLAAIGVASVKAAVDFESSFAGVRKTVNATEPEFAKLAQGFRDLAKTIPVNVNELNRIGEAAGQLGIKKENIIGFTEVVAKMGVTTNLSSEEAANAFARISNIMGTNQKDFDRLGSTIVSLGNNLATTESEITEFGLRIAGAGKIAGLTEAQVLAIGGAMSSVGVEAEAGGTAVQKVLLNISKAALSGGDQLALYAKTSGMTAAEFKRAWEQDAGAAFTSFVEGLGKSGDEAQLVLEELGLTDQRLIRSFLSLAGAGGLLRESIDIGNKAWEENNALTKEAEERFKTFASRFELVKNKARDVAITLGELLLPYVEKLLNFISETGVPALEKMIKAFESLPKPAQDIIVAGAALLATLGPLLIMVGAIAGAIGNLIPVFGFLLGPVGLVIAAIAALAAGLIYAYNHSETFRDIVQKVWAVLKVGIATAVEAIVGYLQRMVNFWLTVVSTMLAGAVAMFGWVPGVGPKLREAQADFEEFRAGVNAKFEDAKGAASRWQESTVRDATGVIRKLHEVDATDPTVTFATVGVATAIGAANSVANAVRNIPTRWNTHLTTTGTGAALGGLRARHQGGLVFHDGGPVQSFHNGGLKRDERLAKLQIGEFVMRRSAVQSVGVQNLQALNQGKVGAGGNTFIFNMNATYDLENPNTAMSFANKVVPLILRHTEAAR